MSAQQIIETIHELGSYGLLVQVDSDEALAEALAEICDED